MRGLIQLVPDVKFALPDSDQQFDMQPNDVRQILNSSLDRRSRVRVLCTGVRRRMAEPWQPLGGPSGIVLSSPPRRPHIDCRRDC
jgi:hypothetical protein